MEAALTESFAVDGSKKLAVLFERVLAARTLPSPIVQHVGSVAPHV